MLYSGRNLWLKKRYLVYGKGVHFHRVISVRQGWKHLLDYGILRCSLFPSLRRRWVVKELTISLSSPPTSFLFFDTSDYKDTYFIGQVAQEDGKVVFVKIYKEEAIAQKNRQQTQRANEVFADSFVVAQLQNSGGRVLSLEVLQKARNATIEEVWPLVFAHSLSMYRTAEKEHDWSPIVPWYTGDKITKEVVGHGDLSHWNCFWDEKSRLCLVDYEELGDYPPMYDCFHLLLKPTLLNTTADIPMWACNEIATATQEDVSRVLLWLFLYLACENKKDRTRNKILNNSYIAQAIENRCDLQQKCQEKIQSYLNKE